MPGQELPGERLRDRADLVGRALGDDPPAVLAGARAHVDEVVGGAHRLLVVLDDDHGVAQVAQPLERGDQLVVVALVQADRRLVEDVEHADQRRADLRGQPDPLRLAARQRRRRPLHRQVADADVVQEAQPLVDLAQDQPGDLPLVLGRAQLLEPRERPPRRQRVNSWIAVPPTSTARDSGRSRAPLQAGHGRSVMNSSIFSRESSESVSR